MFGQRDVVFLNEYELKKRGLADGDRVDLVTASGTVWSCPPAISSSGPRSPLRVSTASSECGVTFAVAAWNSGLPGAGIAHRPCSASDSSSLTVLANA